MGAASAVDVTAMRKVGRRIVPFLALLYFAAFLDRSNVSFAAPTMNKALGFSPYVYGLGAGIFFIGYVLFEVPSNLILHRVGARRWIARIMTTWAVVAGAMALVNGPLAFYVTRFLLGVAEAGFFPGVIYYLTLWAPAGQRARIIGLFMTAIAVSTAIGGPLSSAILRLEGVMGLAGWRWLFLVEAVPSLVLGVATLFFLPDRPGDATWLSADEKAWIGRTLEAEAARRPAAPQGHGFGGLADPMVAILALAYFGVEIGLYGVILWIPQILTAAGVPTEMAGYVVAVPYAIAAVAMVWWCRRSDKARERPWHMRQVVDARKLEEGAAVTDDAADRHPSEIHAMVAALTADQPRAGPLPYRPLVGQRHLQRRISRLGTGAGKENTVHAGRHDRRHPPRRLEGDRVGQLERRRVVEFVYLPSDRLGDPGPSVAGVDAPKTRGAVDEGPPVKREIVHVLGCREQAWRGLEGPVVGERHPEGVEVALLPVECHVGFPQIVHLGRILRSQLF